MVFVSSMPLVFILGFIWPSELLPQFLQDLSFAIPAYHGVKLIYQPKSNGRGLCECDSAFFNAASFVCAMLCSKRNNYPQKTAKGARDMLSLGLCYNRLLKTRSLRNGC